MAVWKGRGLLCASVAFSFRECKGTMKVPQVAVAPDQKLGEGSLK